MEKLPASQEIVEMQITQSFFSNQINRNNTVMRGILHHAMNTQEKKNKQEFNRGSRIKKSGKIMCQIWRLCAYMHFKDCTHRSRISSDPKKVNYLCNENVSKY